MKRKILNSKGISLISLSIAVMVILVITGTIIYNIKDNLKIERLEQMQSDIENLRDKVNTYYAQYGTIPAKFDVEYTNTSKMKAANIISSAVDTGKFYVIDLQAIENLTLSFGQDYETVKNLTTEEIDDYENLYIINADSHNIFYPRGIEIDGEVFYTNYTADDVDTEAVKLHYVENVKIPDGYKYISGTKTSGIIIENKDTSEQYKWIVLNSNIKDLPEGIAVEDETVFLKSANLYDGYYQSIEDTTKVLALSIEEKWSSIYDANGVYKDKNADTAIIPAGFKVSQTPGMDTINDGLVISDEEGNEFVWIPVENIDDFHAIEGYYKGSLQSYLSNCSEPYEDGYSTEVAEYNAMKQSVEENKGFYIGRFEAGKDDNGNVIVKKDVAVYNNIGWNDSGDMDDETGGAVELAKNFDTENGYTSVTSTLVYGVQWDATMQFFDSNYINGECEETSYVVNSTDKGNYSGSIINTGSNDNYAVKNIYDMAGNVLEWTMEAYSTDNRVRRGGSYYGAGSDYPASPRGNNSPSFSYSFYGFRLALYL